MANSSLLALALVTLGPGDDPPAVRVVAHRPSDQLALAIALFDDTPARDPAAWLAAWRRATGNADLLPKAPQALIAALNPGMIAELAALDGATFQLHLDHAGAAAWSLRMPHDDGTFAALADALALTDGGADKPLDDGTPVDRLDTRGALLSAQTGGTLAFASSRDALRRAVRESPDPDAPPGLVVHLDPARLAQAQAEPLARLGRSLRDAGLASIDARLALETDALALEARAPRPARAISSPLDPSWLSTLPADAPLVFACAVDSDAIDLLTGLAAGLLPDADATPRARLSALALAAGIAPEFELWPCLRGLSSFVLLDNHGRPLSAALTLHTRDPKSARRLADRTLPRLLRPITSSLPPRGGPARGRDATGTPADTTASRENQPRPDPASEPSSASLVVSAHQSDVLLAWGQPALDAATLVRSDPARSLGRTLDLPSVANTDHLALLRPGPLLRSIVPADSPAAAALDGARPLLIHGRREPDALVTFARWPGLRDTVRRLVAATPQAPAAEPSR